MKFLRKSWIIDTYELPSLITARAAKNLAEATGVDPYEILSAVSYASADLNWNNKKSRSSLEMNDQSSRPELKDHTTPYPGRRA